jgi:5-methylthioribose kinase
MIILNPKNIHSYIKTHLAEKLGFAARCQIDEGIVVGGGLVSSVFKAKVDGQHIYLKQAIPGRLDKVKELLGDIPEEAFIVFNDDRQFAEIKALAIFAKAVPEGFVPRVYYHDTDNRIIVLSEVCDENGTVLADRMNFEMNLNHAVTLGKNIALVANYTYGKFEQLRDQELERKIRQVKYKYEVGEVWDNIQNTQQKKKALKKVNEFIRSSLAISKVLVHGDYHERNILICNDRCGTFDLEESHWGDPIEDIGKLSAAYVLRIIYFEPIREIAYQATVRLIDSYFGTLRIPESSKDLKKRFRVMLAGCLLLRIDGISSKWLPWVHEPDKKEITRRLAFSLATEEESRYPLEGLIDPKNF